MIIVGHDGNMSGIKWPTWMSTSASDAVSPPVSDRSRPALIHQSALPSPNSSPCGLRRHRRQADLGYDRKREPAGRQAHDVCFLGYFTGRYMMFLTHLLCFAAGSVWIDSKFADFFGLFNKSTVLILFIWKTTNVSFACNQLSTCLLFLTPICILHFLDLWSCSNCIFHIRLNSSWAPARRGQEGLQHEKSLR